MVEYTYNELNQLCNYTNPDGLFYTFKYDGTGMRVSSVMNSLDAYYKRGVLVTKRESE